MATESPTSNHEHEEDRAAALAAEKRKIRPTDFCESKTTVERGSL